MSNASGSDSCPVEHTAAAAIAVADLSIGDDASLLLDVFPDSTVIADANLNLSPGKTEISTTYKPSGSTWQEGLDESQVFLLEMKHTQNNDDDDDDDNDDDDASFTLRIGKGGQIYSLRGSFGESLPPSWRDPAYKHRSPWNDEVWQFVAVCQKYNDMSSLLRAGNVPNQVKAKFEMSGYNTKYFVHNSGAYIPGDIDKSECTDPGMRSLYCPLLASEVGDDGRTYRTCNFGLVPQVRTMHRSPLLYYCQTRDVGEGVIELTWVVHNFSVRDDLVFDHLNAPWGGTRVSSLPNRYISLPNGKLERSGEGAFKKVYSGIPVRETGGYNISAATEADDSPALALVFGRDRHLEAEAAKGEAGRSHCQFAPSTYRDWRPGGASYDEGGDWGDYRTRPDNSFRNYDVAVVIPKFKLAPGTSIWYRSFLVDNRKDRAIELAASLVDKVDYGLATFDRTSTPMTTVRLDVADNAFELFTKPVKGTMPLFLIENATTGQKIVTTDPYHFVPKERLNFGLPPSHPHHDYYRRATGYSLDKHNSRWKRLLGYGRRGKPRVDGDKFTQLSNVFEGTAYFPDADFHHLDLWVEVVSK